MAIAASSKSLWCSTIITVVFFWYLFHTSGFLIDTTPVTGELDLVQILEASYKNVNAELAITASALETGSSSGEDVSPNDDLVDDSQTAYDGPHENFQHGGPDPPAENCPVCPEPIEKALSQETSSLKHVSESRPLILYAYKETDWARQNLQFFVEHGLHSAADFVFILNGETDVGETIIFNQTNSDISERRELENIKIIKRKNECFDLGAHAEVLNGVLGGIGWSDEKGPIASPNDQLLEEEPKDNRALKERYEKLILMNASIRGPFVPLWSDSCWSDAYLNKLTETIKLVGMSYNCHGNRGHVQSMIWATDSVGLNIILGPAGIGECFPTLPAAVEGEIRTTQLLRDNGYEVDVFLSVYHSKDKETEQGALDTLSVTPQDANETSTSAHLKETVEEVETALDENLEIKDWENLATENKIPGDFWKSCTDIDWLRPGGTYFGTFVHPYENLFMKSHRGIEDTVLDRLTNWHNGRGYSSYDVCS